MGLKIFGKPTGSEGNSVQDSDSATHQRVEKLEHNLNELGGEVLRLRQEVNILLARQHTFKMALGRLREYLEDRGAHQEQENREGGMSEEVEIAASFQDISHDAESDKTSASSTRGKAKTNLH